MLEELVFLLIELCLVDDHVLKTVGLDDVSIVVVLDKAGGDEIV